MPGTARPNHWNLTREHVWELSRAGNHRLLLGGQVHNSSSSSPEAIAASFAHARAVNANMVIAPVSWAQFESTEGTFDASLLDTMLAKADELGLALVLLWFGSWKNATSTYAPRWVRADVERFPRARIDPAGRPPMSYEGATPVPVLTAFSPGLLSAEKRAFAKLVQHVAQVDHSGVVAMIQVENEAGILGDGRDRSPQAEAAWKAEVPGALLAHLQSAQSDTLARRLWKAQGSPRKGTWSDVIGVGSAADEVFMAWSIGSYVDRLASHGREFLDIPMFANAWLGPQPGMEEPGQYPSGGPAARVLDVWRAAAPELALLAPDIYIPDADAVMQTYAGDGHPFFVPECRPSAGELVRAVGTYGAVGWSVFGIDDSNPHGQLASTLGYLTGLEAEILEARVGGRLAAVVLDPGMDAMEVTIGDVRVIARAALPLFRHLALDAGVVMPDGDLPVPDETTPGTLLPTPGEKRPFALIMGRTDNTVVVVGQGLILDFWTLDGCEVDEVEELVVRAGTVTSGRILNGDERLQNLPVTRVGGARISLLRG